MIGARSLTRADDWRRVQTTGSRGRCEHLRVRLVPRNSGDLPSRLGLRVRSQGPARAVARNRARRRLRAAWEQIGPATGWDVVIASDIALNGKTFQEVVACLERAVAEAMEDRT